MDVRQRRTLAAYTGLVVVVLGSTANWHVSQNLDTSIRVWLLLQPWSVLLRNVTLVELAPPFWHVLAKSVLAVSPFEAILTLRLLNLALFAVMIPAGYWAGRLLGGAKAGWATVLLLPWSATLLTFVTRTDHYFLYATLAVAYTALLLWTLHEPTRTRALVYAVVTAAFGLTHYFALTYVGGTILALLAVDARAYGSRRVLAATWDDVRSRTLRVDRFDSPSLVPLTVSLLPLCLGYLAWFPSLYSQLVHYRASYDPTYSSLSESVVTMLGFLASQLPAFAPLGGVQSPGLGIVSVVFFTTPLGALGLWSVLRERKRSQIVVVGGASIGAAVVLASGRFYDYRHGLWMAAIAPLVVGVGVRSVAEALGDHGRVSDNWSSVLVVGVLLLLSVSAVPALATSAQVTQKGTDVHRFATVVQESHTDDSVVLTSSPWGEMMLRVHGVDAPIHGVPVDAVDGDRVVPARADYDPGTHPEDFRRVRRLTAGKDRVVVFNAHGMLEDRLPPLPRDLASLGYTRVRTYSEGPNGVIVFERRGG